MTLPYDPDTQEETSLDPEETSVIQASTPLDPATDVGTLWRHSGWQRNRSRVQKALSELADLPPDILDPKAIAISSRRPLAFGQCGQDAYVEQRRHATSTANPSTEYRLRQVKCHDRFCLPCSQERARKIRESLLIHMHGRKQLSLITLTLRAVDQPLTQILDRAYTHFKALRHSSIWEAVAGGAGIIEVKLADHEGRPRWNVHWHLIVESKYMRQEDLAEQWRLITKDSYIVDIRRVGAFGGAVQYITKYVTKAGDQSILNSPAHLKEAIIGFTGRRLVTTFGTWRGLKLIRDWSQDNEESKTAGTWATVGTLNDIYQRADRGDIAAEEIIRCLRRPTAGSPAG